MGTGIIFLLLGVLTILLTLAKPNFYWNSRKAMRLRKLIGDIGASIAYLVIGGVLTIIGLGSVFGIIPL